MTRIHSSFSATPTHHQPTATTIHHQGSSSSTISSASNKSCSLLAPIYAVADFLTWLFQTIFFCFDYSEEGRLYRELVSFKETIIKAKDKCDPRIDLTYETIYEKLPKSTQEALQKSATAVLEARFNARPALLTDSTFWSNMDADAVTRKLTDLGERFAAHSFTATEPELAGLVNKPTESKIKAPPYEDTAHEMLLEVFKGAEALLKP